MQLHLLIKKWLCWRDGETYSNLSNGQCVYILADSHDLKGLVEGSDLDLRVKIDLG